MIDKTICSRCGKICRCDAHHITPRVEGGDNTSANIIQLCPDCHKFVHAELKILNAMVATSKARTELLVARLRHLCKLNTPEKIIRFGYRTYYDASEIDRQKTYRERTSKERRQRRREEQAGRELEYALARVYSRRYRKAY